MSTDNDFLWLEDLHSEESQKWVSEQNKKSLADIQAYPHFGTFVEEAKKYHSSEGALPFRFVRGDCVYYLESSEKNPLGRWLRVPLANFGATKIPWELLLDLDELSKKEGRQWYYAGANFAPSGDRCMLALSDRGLDRSVKREFDVGTRSFVSSGFVTLESKAHTAWYDHETLLVSAYDLEKDMNHLGYSRHAKLWRRGESPQQMTSVLEAKFNEQGLWIENIADKKCLIYENKSWDERSIHLLDEHQKLHLLNLPSCVGQVGVLLEDVIFYLPQNFEKYKAGSVLRISLAEAISKTPLNKFEVLFEDSEDVFTDGINLLQDSFVVTTLKNVSNELWHFKKIAGRWASEKIILPAYTTVTDLGQDKITQNIFLVAENFTSPKSVYQLQSGNHLQLLRQGHESFTADIEVHQNWTISKDGAKVPYFVVHKKNLKLDGSHPTLLNAYGGFAHSRLPTYMPATGKLWLEKGGIFVLANIRGGSEFGMKWHRAAILENKQKSYDDFIAVAEDLIKRKYTSPKKLGIRGGSNGGLLMGAVMTQRPDLFNAVLCEVPLLDMIRYVELPPGASWIDEYGDPREEKMRAVIMNYSPYQNLRADMKYPKIFFRTSVTDDRVHPSHARRMAAKMNLLGHSVLFYEENGGGHGGGDLQTKAFADSLCFSYLWSMLG